MSGLAVAFLHDQPEYMVGLIMIGLVNVALWFQNTWYAGTVNAMEGV